MTSLKLDTIATLRSNPQAILRLTALWAVVESGLGGILHAIRLPMMGIVMGGIAVILITLIAHFAEKPREILRATIIVLIIKALVSPHSPIGAYLAVSFQGILGWLVYSLARPGYLSTVPYALVAVVESAIQKLLMLMLFFGKPLWTAVDSWGMWVLERYFPAHVDDGLSLSWTLVAGYLGAYVIGGLFIGVLAARIPKRIEVHLKDIAGEPLASFEMPKLENEVPKSGKKRKRKLRKMFWWIGVSLALGASIYFGNTATNAIASSLLYFVRTLAIVAVWYFLVAPLLAKLFRKWLLGRSSRYANDIDEVMEIVPLLKQISKQELKRLSSTYSGVGLYRRWFMRVLAVSLTIELSPKPALETLTHAE